MKKLSRFAVVLTLATVGLVAGTGSAAAAPSCVGGSLSYRGINDAVKAEGLKNLGESFSTQARELGGIGQEQSKATKQLIVDCR